MSSRPLIELRAADLRVAYRETVALKISSLAARGKVIAVIGHNGSGKSTLLKTLLGLLVPRSGSISAAWVADKEPQALVPEKHMAFAPETGAIFDDVSVESYLQLWCRIKHRDAAYYRKDGSRHIERFNLTPLLSKLGRELSKGQRQRVQAAVGFLIAPRLFLFDEPFDGLDIKQSSELAAVMAEESDKTAVIVSSHRVEVIERLADEIVVLKDGEVLACGNVDEVCRSLCERSVVLRSAAGVDDVSRLLLALKQEYISCLINQIGARISVIGPDLDPERIRQFLREKELGGYELEVAKPTLSDAMNYHLRRMH